MSRSVPVFISDRDELAAKAVTRIKDHVTNPTHFDRAILSVRSLCETCKGDPESQDVLSGMVLAASVVASLDDVFDTEMVDIIIDAVMAHASLLAYSQVHDTETRSEFDSIVSQMKESFVSPPEAPKTEEPANNPDLPGYL